MKGRRKTGEKKKEPGRKKRKWTQGPQIYSGNQKRERDQSNSMT